MKTNNGSNFNQSRAKNGFFSKIAALTVGALGVFLFVAAPTTAVAAEPLAVAQCSDAVNNNVGGRGVTCDITITNNLNLATGSTDSVVVTNVCEGAANAPLTCIENTQVNADQLVSSATQCNMNTNGGGGALDCSVTVINNIIGQATKGAPTVNQCVGSGGDGGTEPTLVCNPFPANTTNAAITQCNGSGNGGGGTMRVRCTVDALSEVSSAIPFTVNQCNGSSNGDGATVVCDVLMTTNIVAAPVTPTEPTTPTTPTTPTEPTTPTTPTVPTEPTTPTVPTVPETPTTPIVPETPTTPQAPGIPLTPGAGTPPEKTLAKTGADTVPLEIFPIAGGLMILGAAAIFFVMKRRSMAEAELTSEHKE